MTRNSRRLMLTWGLRLVLGVALGWGFRVVYERRPGVRFATGMMVRTVRVPDETHEARGAHLSNGQPHFFSLDQIMAADDPAATLRAWREAFRKSPQDVQRAALEARAEVSVGSLRRLLLTLPRDGALREEMGQLLQVATDLGADLYDRNATQRSLVQLAQLDPGLALDGAAALGKEEASTSIWAVIAEDDPERVIELAGTGQAPPEALSVAVVSLAARDLPRAIALLETLPESAQGGVAQAMADGLARTRPLESLMLEAGPDGTPNLEMARLIIPRVPGPLAIDFLLGLERQHPELLDSCQAEVAALLRRQARREPGFVFEWLERQPDNPLSSHTSLRSTLRDLAAHDPQRAAALLQRWPLGDPSLPSGPFSSVLSVWLVRDSMAAMQWITQQPDSTAWQAALQVTGVRPHEAPALAAWLAENAPDWSPASLVEPWIRHDARAAVAWALNQPPDSGRAWAIANAASALAFSRHPDRQKLIESLAGPTPEDLGTVLTAVHPARYSLGAAATAALPRLLAQSSPELEVKVAGHLASEVRHPASREAVLEAITRLPDPQQRQRLLHALAQDVGSRLPLTAARRLAAAMPDAEAARQFIEEDTRQRFQPNRFPR